MRRTLLAPTLALVAALAAVIALLGNAAFAQSDAPRPEPSPMPTPGAGNPCVGRLALLSRVDRPATGRATSMGGSPCAVPKHRAEFEFGYRNQVTSNGGGTSTLTGYPLDLLRLGLDGSDELVILPPTFNRRVVSRSLGSFASASGYDDSGIGMKRALSAGARMQTALGALYTAPSGFPTGSNGFGSGGPGYSVGYMINYAVNDTIGVNLTEVAGSFAGPDPEGTTRRYFASSPSLTLSFAFGLRSALLIQDAVTSNTGPGAGSANRALVALQRLLSPSTLVDVEYEQNLTPPLPRTAQHAIGFGATLRL